MEFHAAAQQPVGVGVLQPKVSNWDGPPGVRQPWPCSPLWAPHPQEAVRAVVQPPAQPPLAGRAPRGRGTGWICSPKVVGNPQMQRSQAVGCPELPQEHKKGNHPGCSRECLGASGLTQPCRCIEISRRHLSGTAAALGEVWPLARWTHASSQSSRRSSTPLPRELTQPEVRTCLRPAPRAPALGVQGTRHHQQRVRRDPGAVRGVSPS